VAYALRPDPPWSGVVVCDVVDTVEAIEIGSVVLTLSTPDLTVRVTNRSIKVGFILTPTNQPRVYSVYSVHDVQSVPTRVEKGEDLDESIALKADRFISTTVYGQATVRAFAGRSQSQRNVAWL
jgi:hypothetical protein